MASASRSLLYSPRVNSHVQLSPPPPTASRPLIFFPCDAVSFPKLSEMSNLHRYSPTEPKVSPGTDCVLLAAAAAYLEDGVSLGTMKLPSGTDIQRFEPQLF